MVQIYIDTVIQECPLLNRRKRNKNRFKMIKLINLVISFTLVVGNRNRKKTPSPLSAGGWGLGLLPNFQEGES